MVDQARSAMPPDPGTATTASTLVGRLDELRRWAGQPSLRQLRQLGGTCRATSGDIVDALPPSTVSYVLRRRQLPRLDFVEAFVTACLRARHASAAQIGEEVGRWRQAWRGLAAEFADGTDSTTSNEPAEPAPLTTSVRAYHQLPADIAEFTGRQEQVRTLADLVMAGPGEPTSMAVAAIEGMAGVGKTRLAVHVAHLLARSSGFDTLLYVDLYGFAADRPPADPAAVLDTCLRLLGVPGQQIPHDLAARAALYRDRLHSAKALLLLDNAASETQVAPLLPANPACLVLVTSRRTLALDGAHPLRLDVFTTIEAVDLLARVAGPARVASDPGGAAEVAGLCGNLPLAVILAARRLQARPAWTLADLAARLRDADRRLDELSVGGRTVTAVFALSYQALDDERRRMFRLLGLHPGDEYTADSAAALAGTSPCLAGTLLEALVDEHLLEQAAPGRYHSHDLLRRYAHRCALVDETPAQRAGAVRRVLAWYLSMAAAADRLVDPHHRHVDPGHNDGIDRGSAFTTRDDALAWLGAEHANLTAAVHAAAIAGEDSIAWRLTAAMWSFLYLGKHWDDWIVTHHTALAAAGRAGQPEGQAWTLNNLGLAHWQLHDYDLALDCYRQALEIRRTLGDRDGQGVVLDNLGSTYDELGRHEDAVDCYRKALALAEPSGDRASQATILNNLGEAYRRMRRFDEARDCLTRALAIQRDIGDRLQRFTLCSLGELHDDLGDPVGATDYYRQGLGHAGDTGDRWLTALLLDKLGHALSAAGDLRTARAHWHEATAIYAEIGDPRAAAQLRAYLDNDGADPNPPAPRRPADN